MPQYAESAKITEKKEWGSFRVVYAFFAVIEGLCNRLANLQHPTLITRHRQAATLENGVSRLLS